MKKYYH